MTKAEQLRLAVIGDGKMGQAIASLAAEHGFEVVDVSKAPIPDQIEQILGVPEVDSAVDAVGFEASDGHGHEQPAVVLNDMMKVTRAGGAVGNG